MAHAVAIARTLPGPHAEVVHHLPTLEFTRGNGRKKWLQYTSLNPLLVPIPPKFREIDFCDRLASDVEWHTVDVVHAVAIARALPGLHAEVVHNLPHDSHYKTILGMRLIAPRRTYAPRETVSNCPLWRSHTADFKGISCITRNGRIRNPYSRKKCRNMGRFLWVR